MSIVSKGLIPEDLKGIEDILRSTGFFYEFEIEIALGIAEATLDTGADKSDYLWMKIINDDGFVAFANYTRN